MKAYKALKPDLTSQYGEFQFEIGIRYSVEGEIVLCKNGFHACEKVEDIFNYYTWNSRIFEVEIEGDVEQGQDKVVARHCTLIREITDEVKSSEAIMLEVIRRDCWQFRFMQNPSETIQMAAVQQNKSAIKYIKKPTEAIQMAAVEDNSFAIRFIKNPSENLRLFVVKRNGHEIAYIENPSEAVQLAAVKQNKSAIKYIKKPTEAVKNFSDQQFS